MPRDENSKTSQMVAYVASRAPAGSDVWLLTKDIADRFNTSQTTVGSSLTSRVLSGEVLKQIRDERVRWQAGTGEPVPSHKVPKLFRKQPMPSSTAPRPGSSIDKTLKALQSFADEGVHEVDEDALIMKADLIRGEDPKDALRFGVRAELFHWWRDGEVVLWALGARGSVRADPAPVPANAPALVPTLVPAEAPSEAANAPVSVAPTPRPPIAAPAALGDAALALALGDTATSLGYVVQPPQFLTDYRRRPATKPHPSDEPIDLVTKVDDALQRLMHRPFRCAVFNNDTFTLQKGAADIELTFEEALEAYELLSLLARKKGVK